MKGMMKVMTDQQAIAKLYEQWETDLNENHSDSSNFVQQFTQSDRKKMFLADAFVGIDVDIDEPSMSLKMGGILLESLNHINNETTYEYTEDKENYLNFLFACHIFKGWLNYAPTVRHAFFEPFALEFEPSLQLVDVGHHSDTIVITDSFIAWFLEFMNTDSDNPLETNESALNLEESIATLKRLLATAPTVENVGVLSDIQSMLKNIVDQLDTAKAKYKYNVKKKGLEDLEEYAKLVDRTVALRLGELIDA